MGRLGDGLGREKAQLGRQARGPRRAARGEGGPGKAAEVGGLRAGELGLALSWPTRGRRRSQRTQLAGLGAARVPGSQGAAALVLPATKTTGRPPNARRGRRGPIPGSGRRIRRGKVLAATNLPVSETRCRRAEACERWRSVAGPSAGLQRQKGEAGGRVRPGTGQRRAAGHRASWIRTMRRKTGRGRGSRRGTGPMQRKQTGRRSCKRGEAVTRVGDKVERRWGPAGHRSLLGGAERRRGRGARLAASRGPC